MKPGAERSVLERPDARTAGAYPLAALTYAAIRPLALDAQARRDTPRSSTTPPVQDRYRVSSSASCPAGIRRSRQMLVSQAAGRCERCSDHDTGPATD